jgi:hypothetical protein
VDCSGDCRDLPNGSGVTHAIDLGGVRHRRARRPDGRRRPPQPRIQPPGREPRPGRSAADRLAVGALWQTPLGRAGTTGRFDLRVAADVDRPWGQDGDPAVRLGVDLGYKQIARVRAGYGQRSGGESSASIGLGLATGSIGVDLAQTFLSSSELEAANPTYFSFRVIF